MASDSLQRPHTLQAVVIEKFGAPNGHLKSQQASTKEYAFDIAFPHTVRLHRVAAFVCLRLAMSE